MREVDTVTNEDIRRALLSVRPDDAARARMLGHIRAAAACILFRQFEYISS